MTRFWYIYLKSRFNYIGKVEATETEIRNALGPYIDMATNGEVIVFCKPVA